MAEALPDWQAFFTAKLRGATVPALAAREYASMRATIRDRYLDARVELEEIHKRLPRLTMVSLYADVLRVPKGYRLQVDQFALFVFARRIEFEDESASIDVDWSKKPTASLTLFAQELVHPAGATPLRMIEPARTTTINAQDVSPQGLLVAFTDQPLVRAGGGIPAKLAAEDSPLALSLGSIFQTATLLFHDPAAADVVRAQLAWVQACAAQSEEQSALMLQSAGLLSMLHVGAAGSRFVPQLSRTVYADTARAFSDKARAIEQQYERFADQQESIDARIAAAKLLIANADDAIAATDALLAQASANVGGATKAMESAEENLRKQTDLVDRAAVQFQVALGQWVERKKIEAAFTILSSIATFGVGAAKIAYGDAAAGGAAADAAMGALRSAGTLGVYAEAARQVGQTMDKLRRMLEILGKLYTLARSIAGAGLDLSKAGAVRDQLRQADLTEDSDLGPERWDIFRLQADLQLDFAVAEKIDTADDYRQQLRVLVIYGKALTSSRTAFIGAAQEVARLQIARELHEKEKARTERYVADLVASREPKAALQQLFFQRFLDAKRSLVVALEHYRAAYEYWALQPSTVHASIGDRVSVFDNGLSELAQMKLDQEAALHGFKPPPQPMYESFLIDDPTVIASLRETRRTTFTIDLDLEKLTGLGRVRTTTIRAWLIGASAANPSDTIEVILSNSGDYVDRLMSAGREQRFHFTTTPLDVVFRYAFAPGGVRVELPGNAIGWVKMDGKVYDEVSYAYFVPTPFSQWTVRVPETVNRTLDLSSVTGIWLELAGSAIPDQNVRGKAAQ